MIRLLAAFALVLTLGACAQVPGGADALQDDATAPASFAQTAQPAPAADPNPSATDAPALTTLGSAATPAEPAQSNAPVRPPETAMMALQRTTCERGGGRFLPRGTGVYACIFPTSDAGQPCDAAADCEGACLARSRSCAPIQPLFGCQEVFTLPGRREILCTD